MSHYHTHGTWRYTWEKIPTPYLIFVIFFTLTHFESWKFYTRKVRKFTTNGAQSSNFFVFFLEFFTLSQKFYTHGVTGVTDKYQVCTQAPRRLAVLKTIQLVMINYCDGLNLVIVIVIVRLAVLKTLQLVMINYCDCNGLNLVIFIITTICSGFFKTSHISMLANTYMVNLSV